MQNLTDKQKAAFNLSVPALGTNDSGNSAGDIINSLFKLGGTIVTYTSNATPNTEDTVNHNLGYVPQGYIVIGKTVTGDVYNGTTANDASTIHLKCSVASNTITLLVF